MLGWLGRKKLLRFNLGLRLRQKHVNISMPRYITDNMRKFQHSKPDCPQGSRYPRTKTTYGQKIQLSKQSSSSPKLNTKNTNHVQSINGTFLYYTRTINPTLLPALNEISTSKSAPTQDILNKCKQVLNSAAMYPLKTIQYHASNMILMADTNIA